jgi:hypothetical protein
MLTLGSLHGLIMILPSERVSGMIAALHLHMTNTMEPISRPFKVPELWLPQRDRLITAPMVVRTMVPSLAAVAAMGIMSDSCIHWMEE